MRIKTVVTALLIVPVHAAAAAPMSLPSLRPDCVVTTQWVGLVPLLREIVLARCGNETFAVTTPNSLIGHVSINSPQAALEFVRFFTGPSTSYLYKNDGLVELVPGNVTAESDFNVVSTRKFQQWLRPANVRELKEPCNSQTPFLCGRVFEIVRPVLTVDGKILELTEVVYEQGVYTVVHRRTVMRDATKIGVIRVGDH